MGDRQIKGVVLTALKIIEIADGDVLHAMKKSDSEFKGFGDAYFSTVNHGCIKAWKRHREMTLNLIVPVGEIKFVIYDDRIDSSSEHHCQTINLSINNYYRLTVPPMVWLGFQGIGVHTNLLLNVANIEHDPDETERVELDKIRYDWTN